MAIVWTDLVLQGICCCCEMTMEAGRIVSVRYVSGIVAAYGVSVALTIAWFCIPTLITALSCLNESSSVSGCHYLTSSSLVFRCELILRLISGGAWAEGAIYLTFLRDQWQLELIEIKGRMVGVEKK